jgi:hypothetical protein
LLGECEARVNIPAELTQSTDPVFKTTWGESS